MCEGGGGGEGRGEDCVVRREGGLTCRVDLGELGAEGMGTFY